MCKKGVRMAKRYIKLLFTNGSLPALNATNLNAISTALDECDTKIEEIDARYTGMSRTVIEPLSGYSIDASVDWENAYYVDASGFCHLHFAIKKTDGSAFSNGSINQLLSIPSGKIPAKFTIGSAIAYQDNLNIASAWCYTDPLARLMVHISATTGIAATSIRGYVCYKINS